MQNKKLIRFVQSLILLPITTASIPFADIPKEASGIISKSQVVLLQKLNRETDGLLAFNQAIDQEVQIKKIKADSIDAYFGKYQMPLEGTGMKMVEEAEKNNIDWRLLPAIAVRESTGGIHACKKVKYNPFGWGSCKIGFNSFDHAIEIVGKNLGGNNPNTAHHYGDKNTKEILQKYNPPSIVPKYADQVISIMNDIGNEEIILGPMQTENEIEV